MSYVKATAPIASWLRVAAEPLIDRCPFMNMWHCLAMVRGSRPSASFGAIRGTPEPQSDPPANDPLHVLVRFQTANQGVQVASSRQAGLPLLCGACCMHGVCDAVQLCWSCFGAALHTYNETQ